MTRRGWSGVGTLCVVQLAGVMEPTLGCARERRTPAVEPVASSAPPVASAPPPVSSVVTKIAIPAGSTWVGSLPGDPGRDPTVEPLWSAVTLPAFSIDALPYPGVPGQPPSTGVSQAEASSLCAAKGGRLCTEVEWERSCRGPDGQAFPTGDHWEAKCGTTISCTNGFGMVGLGALEEWTADEIESAAGGRRRSGTSTFVRGAPGTSPAANHRCAARRLESPKGKSAARGFRCCYGPKPAAVMPGIVSHPAFRPVEVNAAELTAMLGSAPELASIRQGARLFKESEALSVPSTTHEDSAEEPKITAGPLLWSPVAGTEIVVVTGKSRSASWIAAFHRLPDRSHRLASSMIFEREVGPIALAIRERPRRELGWSLAWNVPGESGAITWRDDHRVVIVQR